MITSALYPYVRILTLGMSLGRKSAGQNADEPRWVEVGLGDLDLNLVRIPSRSLDCLLVAGSSSSSDVSAIAGGPSQVFLG